MKYNIQLLVLILIIFSTLGCKDILDTELKNAYSENLIYSDIDQAERVVFSAYNSTDSWAANRSNWWARRINISGASWEAKFNFNNLDIQYKMIGGWSPGTPGLAFQFKWKNYYDYIRLTNDFLEKIEGSKAMTTNPKKVKELIAEMRFLRANLYSKLIKYFGGVPIIKKPFGLNDNFNIPRNTYQECVEFIVSELDAAVVDLPETRTDAWFGRATKLSALAVKSRTLLYAASKLHDPDTSPNGPLYDYTKSSKWQDASDAAKAIIDKVGERPLKTVADSRDYQNLFLTQSNPDILFARPYSSAYHEFGTDVNSLPDQSQSPNGYGGWGLCSPTYNFSLEFNMKDGTTTNGTNSTYDSTKPNEKRETRFYANLLYQGTMFRGRPVDYALSETPSEAVPHGLDSPEGGGNKLHSSKTGYNIRKFQNESLSSLTETSPDRPYILYRLAEVYLNYSEAQYHLGNEGVSRIFLNKVSNRALQPDITATGTSLLDAIKRERRVELCFEGHNFFDERRWMNQDHIGGYDIKGLKWTKATDGTLSFIEQTVVTRPWFEYRYYLPIPLTEIEKSSALEQNFGY